MSKDVYYLSSLESTIFEPVRKCSFLKLFSFDTGKECVLAELDPPVIGQNFNIGSDINNVVLVNRHEGEKLSSIREFPCFVFITRPLVEHINENTKISKNDLEIIAWGEIYRTESDAANHVFD